VWRRVQVERPSSSTSAGQSGGGFPSDEDVEGLDVVDVVADEDGDDEEVCCLVRAAHEAKDVQFRQLRSDVSIAR
jgi:hypothetical protein